MAYTLRK